MTSAIHRFIGAAFIVAGIVLCASCGNWSPRNFAERPIKLGMEPANAKEGEQLEQKPTFKEIDFRAQNSRALVLMYHDVVEERTADTLFYDVSAQELEQQMTRLMAEGATVISLDQLYDSLANGTQLPEKSVVLTFDDNYQGVFDYAAPILKRYNYPFAVFVHTDFVGNTTQGRPKMTWDTLKDLIANYNVTVGSHTCSHPQDLRDSTIDQINHELKESKRVIKENLGIDTPYLSWPGGNYDSFSIEVAETAGYLMSFAMESGIAQHSPGIMEVRRYPFNKFEEGWREFTTEIDGGWGYADAPLQADAPVSLETMTLGRRKVSAILGGLPSTALINGRKQVSEFMEEFGGVAGINGGFFVMAAIRSDDNNMMGPTIPGNTGLFVPSAQVSNIGKLRNRPLVLWDGKRIAFVPYVHEQMNEEFRLKQFMPDVTDVFLAGAWLVRNGQVMTGAQILSHGASDAMEIRPRSFLGVRADGTMVLGSSRTPMDSSNLGALAALLGCQHAVLLDSGYSTSLIYGDQVVASGHRTREVKSRPIPHAIVVKGTLATESGAEPPKESGN